MWPSFTLVAAIVFNKQRNLLVVPGVLLSMLGICRVLGGDRASTRPACHNVADNPLSYGLAFVGALIWAGYCTVTARLADGKNGVTPFFMLVALALWIKFAIEGGGGAGFSACGHLHRAGGIRAGLRLCGWNTGIMYGNVTVIVGASYFTPVLSPRCSPRRCYMRHCRSNSGKVH